MKKRLPKYFIFLITICIILFVTLLWTLIDNINSLDPESKTVQNVYSFLGDKYLDYCDGMPFYTEDNLDSGTMDDSLKMCLAFKLLDDDKITESSLKKSKKEEVCSFTKENQFRADEEGEVCSTEVVTIKDLNDAYYTLFGEKITEMIDFELSGSKVCYYSEEESSYICGNSVIQSLQLGWAPTTFRMISKVKEKGNQIHLYDYYIAMNNAKCYLTNNGSKENTKCSEKIDDDTKYNSRFVSKYGQKYLHIFEKDSKGNYHWISSSIIK